MVSVSLTVNLAGPEAARWQQRGVAVAVMSLVSIRLDTSPSTAVVYSSGNEHQPKWNYCTSNSPGGAEGITPSSLISPQAAPLMSFPPLLSLNYYQTNLSYLPSSSRPEPWSAKPLTRCLATCCAARSRSQCTRCCPFAESIKLSCMVMDLNPERSGRKSPGFVRAKSAICLCEGDCKG